MRLERLEVSSEVALDSRWDPTRDARGRAFPDGFVATIATTPMRLAVANGGTREVRARLIFPFRASATPGTGFVAPESFAAVQDGRPVAVPASPRELQRSGMLAVRAFALDAMIVAGGTALVDVTVRHALAVNPSWYRFEIGAPPLPRDTAHRYRVLVDARTAVALSLAPGDTALAGQGVTVRLCAAGGACTDHRARLAELDRAWFAARLPAGPAVVTVERDAPGSR